MPALESLGSYPGRVLVYPLFRLLTESSFLFVDLNVLNISSRALSPESIVVKWEPPKMADNSITYKVFQR